MMVCTWLAVGPPTSTLGLRTAENHKNSINMSNKESFSIIRATDYLAFESNNSISYIYYGPGIIGEFKILFIHVFLQIVAGGQIFWVLDDLQEPLLSTLG